MIVELVVLNIFFYEENNAKCELFARTVVLLVTLFLEVSEDFLVMRKQVDELYGIDRISNLIFDYNRIPLTQANLLAMC